MIRIEADDFRQTYVVAKNEIRKFVRGKKLAIYVALVAAIFALITILPYALGGGLGDTPGKVVSAYFMFASFLPVLAATLFASSVYVSEFEERTALILFTRPVKKTSVFIGKFIGCLVLEILVIIGFYVAVAMAALAAAGSIPVGIFGSSLGLICLYMFATSGVAAVFSTMMRKSGTAAIMTFLTILMFVTIFTQIIQASTGADTWFMLDTAAEAIVSCVPEYREMMSEFATVAAPDVGKAAAAMIGWGAASTALSWIMFTRKEL
ncbi:MAG: ABC transporter permease [Candidatus Methanoplasma sp.]|nr:ABC transporter permease [Candidatus Methanoplasma sp.]